MTARWRQLDEHLYETGALGLVFNSAALADDLGLSTPDASALIQAYLNAQRGAESKTRYLLRREGRTRAATWHVGVRTKDVRLHIGQFASDVRRRVERAIEPDLRRALTLNPRATHVVGYGMDAIELGIKMLADQGEET